MVFFESPHRLADALVDASAAFGDEREAAVCRELTKTYEEVRRGSLGELARWAENGEVRGEITVVVGGAPADASVPEAPALAAEAEFHPDFADGLAVQKTLAALQQSAQSGQWTTVTN